MVRPHLLQAMLTGVVALLPSPAAATHLAVRNQSTESAPCAVVARQVEETQGQNIDADVALDCLHSVPLDVQGGVQELLGIQLLAQFQSTLAWLENPPESYPYPAVDIQGGLQDIYKRLNASQYQNEYDFQLDIYELIQKGRDGHFNYAAEIVYGIIAFQRQNHFYSLSLDGQTLPEIYVDIDVPALTSTLHYTPSPVTHINGEDLQTFLNNLATANALDQDRDASFNSLFPNIPNSANGLAAMEIFYTSSLYQGNDTALTFQNGSTGHIMTYATSAADWTGIETGEDFFKKFCSGGTTTTNVTSASEMASASSAALTSTTNTAAPTTFPKPYAMSDDQMIACYFPESVPGLAVLSVPCFFPSTPAVPDFEGVTRKCLMAAKQLGKEKLIVDLRGNGGGDGFMAYDMFKQLFPSMVPWGTTNIRAFPLLDDLGQVITNRFGNVSHPMSTLAQAAEGLPLDAPAVLDVDLQPFTTWKALYGPVRAHGDNFTNLLRYNLSNIHQTGGDAISGYGNLSVLPQQVFDADNIVLLQDGQCGSACATFAEFMRTQAKVRQVVIGGRRQYGPMQAVGGTKGANVYDATVISQMIHGALEIAPPAIAKQLQAEYGDSYTWLQTAISRAASIGNEGIAARVNFRNNIRKGDESLTPLQFVYEAADCRLFYTPEMVSNQESVWNATYQARWQNSGLCVQGSTGQPSSLSGGADINQTSTQVNGSGARGLAYHPALVLLGVLAVRCLVS